MVLARPADPGSGHPTATGCRPCTPPREAGIHEPVTWEPPLRWVTGIPWPGPDPDAISPEDLHPLIRASLLVCAIAARLATTGDHARLTAARHPAPQAPARQPCTALARAISPRE